MNDVRNQAGGMGATHVVVSFEDETSDTTIANASAHAQDPSDSKTNASASVIAHAYRCQ